MAAVIVRAAFDELKTRYPVEMIEILILAAE